MINDALIGALGVILLFGLAALFDAMVESHRERKLEKQWQADVEAERKMRARYEEAIGKPIAWSTDIDPLDIRHIEVKHVPYKGE